MDREDRLIETIMGFGKSLQQVSDQEREGEIGENFVIQHSKSSIKGSFDVFRSRKGTREWTIDF